MSDEARGFPAFPPRRQRQFAATWWGKAWIVAMEEAALDVGRLARGRTYARKGQVAAISVSPGLLAADVWGSREEPYRASQRLDVLSDEDWDRFLDQVASQAGHIASLLERRMPPDLVEAAADVGVTLLPGIGDLDPECDCPDWGHPCKHAAALAYQAAWLLDRDPFVLLLLRGRGQERLLDELTRRSGQAGGADVAVADPAGPAGVPAAAVWAAEVPPLPDPPPVPGPLAEPIDVHAAPGVDPAAVRRLALDAAARARTLLDDPAAPEPGEWQDAVRLAAAFDAGDVRQRLAAATRRPLDALMRAVRAWRLGGPAGLDALESSWPAPKNDLARARAAVESAAADAGGELPVRVWRNRVTATGAGAQLRLGRDGRWYPFRADPVAPEAWTPAGPPAADPGAAVASLSDLLGAGYRTVDA